NLIVDGAISAEKVGTDAITSDKVAANSITASKLLISDLANLYPDFDFDDQSAYTSDSGVSFQFGSSSVNSSIHGARFLSIPISSPAGSVYSPWYSCLNNQEYIVKGTAYHATNVAESLARLEIEFAAISGNTIIPSR